eukprot:Transcript_17325.p1 GENE.Transcript_17325~~Transcript_17325.p1  ORF type:complete len:446 (-),score=178.73 Transcript_17325:122-1459(-)
MEAGGSLATELLAGATLRDEEIPDGRLGLSWSALVLLPIKGRPQKTSLADCVGASAEHGTLLVHTVPLSGGGWLGKPQRNKLVVKRFVCHDSTQAQSWAEAVWHAIHGIAAEAPPPPRKRWLVLINPASGPGHAVRIFDECRPVLEANRVALTEIVTTHAGHATEIASEIKLDEVDGVVCCSGDGLMYELVNGLMARPDADVAVRALRLGALPGGSANSLLTSFAKAAGEPIGPLSSARLLCRGGPQPLDLMRVTQPGRPVSFGFLSMEWAMASDLDLGSDHLRWMGEARFDVYALWRILTLRRYPGSLRVRAKGRDEWQTFEGPFVGLWALNCRWLTATAQLGPRAEFDDGCEDLMLVRRAGRLTLLCTFLDLESGKHADASFVEYLKAEEFELTPLPRTEREPGMVAIDGELMPFATTHVSVLPSKLTMLGGAVPPAEDPGAP